MRLIKATVPPDVLPDVTGTLDEKGVGFFATEETGTDEYAAVLSISVPDEEVEPVLDHLYAAGVEDENQVLILDVEADLFEQADGRESEVEEQVRIATAELKSKTQDLLPDMRTFLAMMILSTIVATAGLLLDSAAVVVGSMVLAPLFGPTISASVGTVVDDSDLFFRGVRFQIVGSIVAVVSATVFAWSMQVAYLAPSGLAITTIPQIIERLAPDFLSLVVALAAGIAGALSLATGGGIALVGVMMAAALLPPAATVGIGIAWGEPWAALNSGLLLVVNLLAINFAGLVALWYLGYRPDAWIDIPQTRRELVKRGGVLLVALLVCSVVLMNVTYTNVQRTQTEETIQSEIEAALDEPVHEEVSLVDVKVVQDEPSLSPETDRVIVTIARPPAERHPGAREKIVDIVREEVGQGVRIDVRVHLVSEQRTVR